MATLLAWLCFAPSAGGQDGGIDVFEILREAEPRGVLATIIALEAVEDEVRGTPEEDLLGDLLATRLAFVHDFEKARRLDSTVYASVRTRGAGDRSLEGYVPRDAVETILELAEGRRVVMFNEEHRRSQERAFAHELLAPLVEAGFTHLALETLRTDPAKVEELVQRGHPLTSSGFYTQDPVLGDLVRRALALGMQVIGYEADVSRFPAELAREPMGRSKWREEQQGRNLADVVRDRPEARLVVWSGRHHMSELLPSAERQGLTPMGGFFRHFSGIDPLTVDLMVMKEADAPERERLVYRKAADDGLVDAPRVFLAEDGTPYSAIAHIDVMVFLPRTRMQAGRPDWMRMGGLRQDVEVGFADVDEQPAPGRPLLVEARIEGESPEAVPLDQVLWRGGDAPVLLLRPGLDYTVRLIAPSGEVLAEHGVGLAGEDHR
ncbi:MAG: hypothetical protein O7B99_13200 [Planctomycetota bacterium]|nr:hypothetical protein [Planctomycetota bacterium]